jgi:O-antigen ligase
LLIWALIAHKFPYQNSSWPRYAAVSLIGLVGACFLFGANQAGRIVGSLGEPNALAATAVFLTAITFGSKSKLLLAISTLICLGIVFVSGSRSSLLALGIMILYYILTYLKVLSTWQRFLIGLILVWICCTLPLLQPQFTFENRSEIWRTSLIAGFDSPIFGHGFGNTSQVLHQTSEKLQNNIRFENVDSAHNLWLDFWVSGGIVSLICLIFLICLSMKKQIHQDNLPLLSAWLGILVMFSFNPMSVVNLVELWWLIGLGLDQDQ